MSIEFTYFCHSKGCCPKDTYAMNILLAIKDQVEF